MKHLFILGAIVSLLLTMPSLSWAATTINTTKSNTYRLVYDTTAVSPAQAAAILADLDKARRRVLSDLETKETLREIMKKHGVDVDRVKKIVILPPDATHKETTILLLANPEDEAQALDVRETTTGMDVDY